MQVAKLIALAKERGAATTSPSGARKPRLASCSLPRISAGVIAGASIRWVAQAIA